MIHSMFSWQLIFNWFPNQYTLAKFYCMQHLVQCMPGLLIIYTSMFVFVILLYCCIQLLMPINNNNVGYHKSKLSI